MPLADPMTLRLPKLLAGALAVLLALAVHPAAGAQDSLTLNRAQVQQQRLVMPNVVGRTLGDARGELEKLGIRVGPVRSAPGQAPEGTVIRQSPAAGMPVVRGSTAALIISSGIRQQETPGIVPPPVSPEQPPQEPTGQPRLVVVPDLVGRSLTEATAALLLARLRPGGVEQVQSPQARPGRVVSQSPAAGERVRSGTPVRLAVAEGGGRGGATVPSLAGATLGQARALLERERLALGGVDSVESAEPVGTVVRQQPESGTEVAPGSRVAVVLATAPQTATVPDLSGRTLDDARILLRRAQLALGAVDSAAASRPAGTIVRQQPAAAAQVRPGTAVAVVLARAAPVATTVPDLSGRTLADARALLGRAGLELGGVDSLESQRPAGTVVRQQPAARTSVAPGSAVTVALARAAQRVTVPNLAGRTVPAAGAALRQAGLVAGAVDSVESGDAAGTVVRQQPAAGAQVSPGAAVTMFVSSGPEPVVPGGTDTTGTDSAAGGGPGGGQDPDGADSIAGPADPSPTIPELRGQTLAEARRALEPLGLSVEVAPVFADSTEWIVEAQSPQAGAPAVRGTAVRLALRTAVAAPPEGGGGTSWPVVIAVVLVLAGAAAALVKLLRRARPPAPKPVPVIATKGEWKPGPAKVAVPGGLIKVQVSLVVVAGEPEQKVDVEGSLIAAEEAA